MHISNQEGNDIPSMDRVAKRLPSRMNGIRLPQKFGIDILSSDILPMIGHINSVTPPRKTNKAKKIDDVLSSELVEKLSATRWHSRGRVKRIIVVETQPQENAGASMANIWSKGIFSSEDVGSWMPLLPSAC